MLSSLWILTKPRLLLQVLAASGVSLDEGAAIDTKAIYLPYGSALILRLSEPEE